MLHFQTLCFDLLYLLKLSSDLLYESVCGRHWTVLLSRLRVMAEGTRGPAAPFRTVGELQPRSTKILKSFNTYPAE